MEKETEKKVPDKKRKTKTKTKPKATDRRTKVKRIILRIVAGIAIFIGVIIIAVAGLIFGSLYGYVEDTELVDVDNMRLNLTSFVYVTDPDTGETTELEALYDNENRVWVSGDKIPDHLKNAFISIEDERFYSHKGVDLKRFVGAAVQYVFHKGDSNYGGSTITQQLIKNITDDDDYSIKRKIQEAYRAYNLEKELSKEEILEYYLNTIYLSQKCNGVQSAAQTYFGKDVSDLSLAECASIAGITQFPTKYDPLVNPESNKERQQIILKKMKDLGFITQKEYDTAIKEKLVFVEKNPEEKEHIQSYFADAVIDQVIEDLMDEYNYTKEYASQVLYNGGLRIYISMDPKMQEIVDSVYNDPEAFQKASTEVQPQSSVVIMDPYTGLVKALSGGRGEKTGNRTLNRATHSLRQPGSTIKPLSVYAPAIEYGLVTPSSIVNDAPIKFGGWSPRNDDHSYSGRITVASALRWSRNIPATKICNYLTVEASFDFVKNNFHVSTLVKDRKGPDHNFSDVSLAPIALGGLTDGVSVLEMCAAYCAFPNGGKYIEPSFYTKVTDFEGNIVLEHKAAEYIAISETTARDMVSMMQGVVTGGTGTVARLSNMPAAGKTGTTSNNHDRWFVGYTPYYVGAVWFGYDQPAPLRGFGSNPAAVAWQKVMAPIHEDLEYQEFFANDTDDKYSIMICADSGMRASPACKSITSKSFKKGDIPKKLCTKHPYTFNKNDLSGGSSNIPKKDNGVPGVIVDDSGGAPGGGSPSGGDTPSGGTPSGGDAPQGGDTPSGGDAPQGGGAPAAPPSDNSENSGGIEFTDRFER